MLPGDAAGELLADPQHALQMTYGCPPAYRKYLWRKPAPTIFRTTTFSHAAAEMAIERPGPQCVPVAGRIEALMQVEGSSNSG